MGDEYFTKLYGLRNEEAKKIRNGTTEGDKNDNVKAQQSNEVLVNLFRIRRKYYNYGA